MNDAQIHTVAIIVLGLLVAAALPLAALGMRVMGGRSCFRFEEMERYYCEAPFSLFTGGTIEVQKMLVARAMGFA